MLTLKADIIGKLDHEAGLALFRGIPYASVEKRWTHRQNRHLMPPNLGHGARRGMVLRWFLAVSMIRRQAMMNLSVSI